jgi:ceramide glucosyltransferase
MATLILHGSLGLLALSTIYALLAIACVLVFRSRMSKAVVGAGQPPVTILKPLCGLEDGLAENLRSFCRQEYGRYQIVFGVRNSNDPAIGVAEEIMAEFPDRDISLVVDDRTIGRNLKVSNLANMFPSARHDILVIADSDMRVRADYLRAVVAPFTRHDVGATTCLYFGSGRGGLASRLGAMFINDWFLPSALIPAIFGRLAFCFGATMAIRREILAAIGGFEALAGYLADDYKLGQFVAERKHAIVLVSHIVENVIAEDNLTSLFKHEIRWARTIRSVRPIGYAFSMVTEIMAIALLAAVSTYVATGSTAMGAALVLGALVLRLVLHYAVCATAGAGGVHAPWLVPVRDLFSFAVRVASYGSNTVLWRKQVLTIESSSHIREPQ